MELLPGREGGDDAETRGHGEITVLPCPRVSPSPCLSSPARALERLLRWDYRIERAMVRMVLEGTDKGPSTDGWVNLSRWAE